MYRLFELRSLIATAEDKIQKTGIGRELTALIKKAASGNYVQLNTAKLKHEIGLKYSRYMGYRQHDAHELFIGQFFLGLWKVEMIKFVDLSQNSDCHLLIPRHHHLVYNFWEKTKD